jgi:hypothetical protein
MTMHHSYYQNDQFHDLDITPTPDTQRYLDQARIQVKQSGNQFSIYSLNQNTPETSGKKWPPLFFYLTLNNINFLNFSALPITSGQFFYFANQNGSQQLTRNEFANNNDLVYYTMPQSRLALGEHISGKVLVKNSAGESVKEIVIEHKDHIDLDMDPGITGYFELWKDEYMLARLFMDAHYSQRTPFGVLCLELNPLTDTQTVPTYQLNFAARKTIWRYYILNKSNLDISSLQIETSNPELQFHEGEAVTMPNGEKARVFFSDPAKPIALTHQPSTHFKLVSSTPPLQITLPNASSHRLKEEVKDGIVQFYSDTYVYL